MSLFHRLLNEISKIYWFTTTLEATSMKINDFVNIQPSMTFLIKWSTVPMLCMLLKDVDAQRGQVANGNTL